MAGTAELEPASAASPPSPAPASDGAVLSLEDELLSAMSEIETMQSAPASAAAAAPPAEAESSAGEKPAAKGLKLKIGKKDGTAATVTAGEGKSAAKPAGKPGGPAAGVEAAHAWGLSDAEIDAGKMPRISVFKQVVRFLDAVLEWAAWPLLRAGPRVRGLVGSLSATTIIVSVGAIYLLPVILPYRDALSFLADRRAALDKPAAASGEEGEGGGEHGGKSSGHEAKKKETKKDEKKKDDGHGEKKEEKKKDEGHGEKKPDAKAKESKAAGGEGHGEGHGAGGEKKAPAKKEPKKDAKKAKGASEHGE